MGLLLRLSVCVCVATFSAMIPAVAQAAGSTVVVRVSSVDLKHSAYCSGVVVSDRRVVTAAHCFDQFQNEIDQGLLDVRVGDGSLARSRKVAGWKVSEYWLHPSYVQGDDGHFDVAVLKTMHVLKGFTSVKLAKVKPKHGAVGTQYGYGAVSGSDKGRLRSGPVKVHTASFCGNPNASGLVCVKPSGSRKLCPGDSGGPLIDSQGILFGIVVSAKDYGNTGCLKSAVNGVDVADRDIRAFIQNPASY